MKKSEICGRQESPRTTMQARTDAKRPVFKPWWKVSKRVAHPNYKHDCYSKYDVLGIWIWDEIQIRALKRRLRRHEPNAGHVAKL